jgi:hypothetical protein
VLCPRTGSEEDTIRGIGEKGGEMLGKRWGKPGKKMTKHFFLSIDSFCSSTEELKDAYLESTCVSVFIKAYPKASSVQYNSEQ